MAMNAASNSSISVAVRVRPFTIREAAQLTKCDESPLFLGDGSLAAALPQRLSQKGLRSVIKVVDEKCLVFDPPEDNPVQKFSRSIVGGGKRVKDQTFMFDRVFDENTSQADVYESTTKNLLDSVLEGYNATVFAYGATGCGKTHTITGTQQAPGIIFLTMQDLFDRIAERSGEKETELTLSYLEIYNETIRDLLAGEGTKSGLALREDANHSVSVPGLSSHHPQNVEEVMEMIVRGNALRTMSPTEANATSSRSHAVLQINVASKDRNADVNEPHCMATLSIIDLAGSERASATKNKGERLIEGANINKSLLALGSCINALCDPRKKNHVPYRNSKLTRLLKFSLGGNCKTVMIVCVSPSSQHFDETQNTLRYANRAKNIQTKVTRNVYNVNRHVKDFLKKIDEQMALINELKAQAKDHEGTAMVKFRKLNEKRDAIAREGIARIRGAMDHSAGDRQEKLTNMKKLRLVERRISVISAWIASFDAVCDLLEDEEAPSNLAAIRKTAQGVLIELEGSRQFYHQKLAKTNWERQIDTALQTGIRQLKDADTDNCSADIANLTREADLLKLNGEREMLSAVLEQEKAGDSSAIQGLLTAQFETMLNMHRILQMEDEDAARELKNSLTAIMDACGEASSNIIKPGAMAPAPEYFSPSVKGTPKRKKAMVRASPMKVSIAPILAAAIPASPIKMSPKRRKVTAKKGISFTPKKKSPVKRAVRWRDDTENGTLTEFEKTPLRFDSTPEMDAPTIRVDEPSPTLPAAPPTLSVVVEDSTDSSPIPTPPESAVLPLSGAVKRNNRMQMGFLTKKTNAGSPPTLTSSSSDSDTSPLRPMDPSKGNRNSLPHQAESGDENSILSGDDVVKTRADAAKIGKAVRKASPSSAGAYSRTQRRRSPTATSYSPTNETSLFTAAHARRMVKSEKERTSMTVLSPRTAPVIKNAARRTTIGEGRVANNVAMPNPASFSGTGSLRGRESLTGSKSAWR